MKTIFKLLLPSVAVLLQINALGATLYVDMQSPSPTMPYSSWATAAANIQDAIDAAVTGDVVLVTNGIYATGGKVMAGDLTNRVAIDKAITVQSVSGPSASIIQGAWDITTTNGPGAVRCVWLGDGGALIGFTTRGGATRGAVGGTTLTTGGGIWCNSSNARIVNCTVAGNAANSGGGGVYRGTLLNTLVQRNMAAINGAGTLFSSLVNCTVVENYAAGINTAGVYGTFTNVVRNSIVWGNVNSSGSGSIEYSGGVFTNTCTRPLPTGSGNISSDPLFDSDGFHLKSGSPCLGAGSSNFISGLDLDGQPYNSPPSMGCDERLLQPAVAQPAIVALGDGKVRLRVSPVGALVESFQWFKDGVALTDGLQLSGAQSSELALSSFAPTDAGFYQAIVTNSFGSATSAVVRISPRFVNASNGTPIPPFTNWASAATTIQDAVDVARSGDLIVVADGIYSSGGKVVSGDLTNRVVLTKALIVTSLNGTTNAIIAGLKDFGGNNGNGNGALRPVWMEHWTSLAGFTVRNGGTRTNGDNALLQSGGGIWGYGMGSSVRGCVITNNSASQNGGGAINVEIESSLLIQNSANRGGGVYGGRVGQSYLIQNKALPVIASGGGGYSSTILNSLIYRNQGGGTLGCKLYNCTVTENIGRGLVSFDFAYNTIMWGNTLGDYGTSMVFHHSCAKYDPTLFGIGGTNNLFIDPQLVDPFHLSVNSPCRGMGGTLFITGTDLDGDAWLNPISMGADEYISGSLTGALSATIETLTTNVLPNRSLALVGRIVGRATRVEWSFGDGPTVTNISYATTHSWTTPGDYTVTFTAYNASNPTGVSTNIVIHVLPIESPTWQSIQRISFYNQFDFITQVGVTNVIEYATNLTAPINWMTLKTSVATNILMQERDTSPTNAARFYRLRSQ